MRRTIALVGLVAAVAGIFGSASLALPERAAAWQSGYFCWDYLAAGSRCVEQHKRDHRWIAVQVHSSAGSGDFCVGAKKYPDGSGANTTPFGCIYMGQGYGYTYTGPHGSGSV